MNESECARCPSPFCPVYPFSPSSRVNRGLWMGCLSQTFYKEDKQSKKLGLQHIAAAGFIHQVLLGCSDKSNLFPNLSKAGFSAPLKLGNLGYVLLVGDDGHTSYYHSLIYFVPFLIQAWWHRFLLFWLQPGHSVFTSKGLDLSPNSLSRTHQKVEIQTQNAATFLTAPPLTDSAPCPKIWIKQRLE